MWSKRTGTKPSSEKMGAFLFETSPTNLKDSMEAILIFLALLGLMAYFFRWIIILTLTFIGMFSGGFFFGLGVGVLAYFLLKLVPPILVLIGAARAAKNQDN